MIHWTDTIATGHPVVDNDHRKLIETLNELEQALLNGAAKDQVERIIAFLNQYSREHFAREEGHMRKVGCPAMGQNCRQHREFEAKLDGWVAKLRAGPSTALVLEIFRETSSWIREHIVKTDCQLRSCRSA